MLHPHHLTRHVARVVVVVVVSEEVLVVLHMVEVQTLCQNAKNGICLVFSAATHRAGLAQIV